MTLTDRLEELRAKLPGCVAAGCVEISTGILVAVDSSGKFPSEMFDLLAAATADLFAGNNVSTIQHMFKRHGGATSAGDGFREMLLISDHHVHYFARGGARSDHVVVAVCRDVANVGLIFVNGRRWAREVVECLGDQ